LIDIPDGCRIEMIEVPESGPVNLIPDRLVSATGYPWARSTAQLPQMLMFRPAPGMGRAETPVERLYLGSASATPGGSVHGACGRNAAKAAPAADGVTGWPRRRLNRAVTSLLTK
jgi:hypothetical protein